MAARKSAIEVGNVVALTGKFLQSTGQVSGGEGGRKWRVLRVDGDFVTVDSPRDPMVSFSKEEFETLSDDDKFLATHRRFHQANLYVVGKPSSRHA